MNKTTLTIEEYSDKVNISVEDLLGNSRKYEHKIPRQLYWLYLHKNGMSKRSIARKFNMAHSSIVSGINTVSNLIETEDKILSAYEDFISLFFI